MLDVFKMKKLGIFAGGVLFGTAGVKLLSSKRCKKSVYKLYSCSASCKRFCYEDSIHCTGKCRRYSGGSKTDQ